MTGSALTRWTLYDDAGGVNVVNLGRGSGGGELNVVREHRLADLCFCLLFDVFCNVCCKVSLLISLGFLRAVFGGI